jgi:inner membrane protein
MPTVFSHGAVGYTAARAFFHDPYNDRIALAATLLAMLPDIDGLYYRWFLFRHPLGHRGMTHSLLFAATVGCVTAMLFAYRSWSQGVSLGRLAVFFSLVTASHGFFDAMTNGGSGVAFFAPFDNTRYFFPFRPIPVSPMSLEGLMTDRGLTVIKAELGFFWSFALAAVLLRRRNRWRMVAACVCFALGLAAWTATILQ